MDCHGSQCGFCTPGFVMSLFALWKTASSPDPAEVNVALAGNLCRCTGYRPIVEAADRMYEFSRDDAFHRGQQSVIDELGSLKASGGTAVNERRLLIPTSLRELKSLTSDNPHATLLAGGTDLNLEVAQFGRQFETTIYLGAVPELRAIRETEDHYLIGAATTLSDCMNLIHAEYPDFGEVLLRFGSEQVRNVATMGGNLGNASPIADVPPALLVLDARIHLSSKESDRSVRVEDFFVGYRETILRPGEFISAIELPKSKAKHVFKMYKVSKRFDDDISAVCAAFYICIEHDHVVDVNIAYGGMAEIPKRASRCEQALVGLPWTDSTVYLGMEQLEEDFAAISDLRASAHYRMEVAKNLLWKCYLETTAFTTEHTRVWHHV